MGARKTALLTGGVVLLLAVSAAWASDAPAAATGPASAETQATEHPGVTHQMMMLVLQLSAILFSAKIGGALAQRIKLPSVLGELAAGIAIGHYQLGGISLPGFAKGLFPLVGGSAVSPELYGLCTVAAIVLLFDAGLETDLKLFLRYSLAGGLVGLGGAAVSFVLGDLLLVVLSGPVLGKSLGFMDPACLLLGTITTATSVGVTARILAQKRKLDCPEGVTVLSAAVIDDVIGIVMLAVVMGLVSASKATGQVDWGRIGVIAAKAVGVWVAATAVAVIASRKVSFLLKAFRDRSAIAIMALGLALLLAGLFEEAGLAMIIGAYTMGLSLSHTDISHVVREKLSVIHALLVPVFFCAIGMRIDLGSIGSGAVLVFAIAYALTAMFTKVAGCGGPALLANFTPIGALRIGFGMIPRCEVALIIAGIGMTGGLLGPPDQAQTIFAAVVVMVLVNTMVAPPVLVGLFNSPRPGTRKVVSTRGKTRTYVPFEFPTPQMAEFLRDRLHDTFDSEGYFVHRLTRDGRLHQLRKDDVIIDMTVEAATITFDCNQREVPLIHTAVIEAIADMEQTLRGLRQSVDTRKIGSAIQDVSASDAQAFKLTNYITPATIEPDLQAPDKEEAIEKLLSLAWRSGKVRDVEAARKAVWDREQSMSTGLQYGVAIPHGRTDAVDDIVCAVGVCREGVEFGSLDGQPSTIFFLTLSPANKPAPHIQFMSTISQLLDDAGRAAILNAADGEQLLAAIRRKPSDAAGPTEPKPTPAAATAAEPIFDIGTYLRADLVQPHLTGTTRDTVLDELLGMLETAGVIRDVEAARAAIHSREDQMPTALEYGVCVPHGRTDAVDDLVCAVGVRRQGVDFGAADGHPSTIFVMTLVPEDKPGPYMQFMAMLVRVLDDAGREKVRAAETPEELYAALTASPRA